MQMCLPGKTGDIIFFAAKIGDSPGVGQTRGSDIPGSGHDSCDVPGLAREGVGEGPI